MLVEPIIVHHPRRGWLRVLRLGVGDAGWPLRAPAGAAGDVFVSMKVATLDFFASLRSAPSVITL